jgi:hypothetical protein
MFVYMNQIKIYRTRLFITRQIGPLKLKLFCTADIIIENFLKVLRKSTNRVFAALYQVFMFEEKETCVPEAKYKLRTQ